MGCALLCSSLLTLAAHQAQGQSISTATVTEILDSNQVFIQNQRAQVNGVAQRQQRVRTQAARTSLRFNTGAVARLAHNSSLVVGQCAQLNRGTLLVNGALNGCSTTTVAGVRGTIYTLEVTEAGQTVIQVFEGEVVVQPQPDSYVPLEEDPLLEAPLEEESLEEAPLPEDVPLETSAPAGGGLAAPKQTFPKPAEVEPSPAAEPTAPGPDSPTSVESTGADSTPVDFSQDSSLVIAEGQQVTVDAEKGEAVIATLTPEDFIQLLEGPLISGFAAELPGVNNLRGAFERLFPGVPLPSGLPVPIPLPSLRFPF